MKDILGVEVKPGDVVVWWISDGLTYEEVVSVNHLLGFITVEGGVTINKDLEFVIAMYSPNKVRQ